MKPLQAIHQRAQRDLRRVVDEQVDVITLAVELDQLGIEVFAHVGKDAMEAVEVLLPEHPAPVFGHEDQVSMDGKKRSACLGDSQFLVS